MSSSQARAFRALMPRSQALREGQDAPGDAEIYVHHNRFLSWFLGGKDLYTSVFALRDVTDAPPTRDDLNAYLDELAYYAAECWQARTYGLNLALLHGGDAAVDCIDDLVSVVGGGFEVCTLALLDTASGRVESRRCWLLNGTVKAYYEGLQALAPRGGGSL